MSPQSDFERFTGPDRRRFPRPSRLGAIVIVIAVVLVVGLIGLWPEALPDLDLSEIGLADEIVPAVVTDSRAGQCSFADDLACVEYEFELTDDPDETVVNEFSDQPGTPQLEVGDDIFLAVVTFDDGTVSYQYADADRRTMLLVLGLVFAVAVVGLGRMRGVAALVGLLLSVALLLGFILPAIVAGEDAVLVALVGGGAIAMISLYLAHGYNSLTHVAALGAFSALVLTTGLSWLVIAVANFSGLVTEEAFFLLSIPELDLNGLLLAGVVLGAIGALDDVTVTQASAVLEVHQANPELSEHDLYQAGSRVGRDHIVSTVNTLLLAYAGASLPLLLFFTISEQSLGVIANSEVVAVEIVRTLVGSMGLVAAVPVTTFLASRVVKQSSRVSP